jgi:hypothetical protein
MEDDDDNDDEPICLSLKWDVKNQLPERGVKEVELLWFN